MDVRPSEPSESPDRCHAPANEAPASATKEAVENTPCAVIWRDGEELRIY